MISSDQINAAYEALKEAQEGVFVASAKEVRAKEALAARRAELLASGQIDGKNAETREAQLLSLTITETQWLAGTTEELREAEHAVRMAGLEIERCKLLVRLLEVGA